MLGSISSLVVALPVFGLMWVAREQRCPFPMLDRADMFDAADTTDDEDEEQEDEDEDEDDWEDEEEEWIDDEEEEDEEED